MRMMSVVGEIAVADAGADGGAAVGALVICVEVRGG